MDVDAQRDMHLLSLSIYLLDDKSPFSAWRLLCELTFLTSLSIFSLKLNIFPKDIFFLTLVVLFFLEKCSCRKVFFLMEAYLFSEMDIKKYFQKCFQCGLAFKIELTR